jgi:dolichol kinase
MLSDAVLSIYLEQADLLLLAIGAVAALCLPNRKKTLSLLLLTLVIAFTAKEFYAAPRPCAENPLFCLPSHGMPSIHAATATVIALASVGTAWFYLFAPAAALVAASRVAFGVHSFPQVAAGVALGAAVWLVASELLDAWRKRRERKARGARALSTREAHAAVPRGFGEAFRFEARRQGIHMLFGALVIAIALVFGKDAALASLLVCLACGLVIMQFAARGVRFFFSDWALRVFERSNAKAGWGALNFVVGALFAIAFSQSLAFGCAAVAFLAFGDGFSTIIGMAFGRTAALGSKSWEGFAGFVGAAFIPSFFLIGWQSALFYSVVLGFVELVDFKINDNLLIPICAVALRQFTRI